MRAPSFLLDVLLHAGMSALTRYFPGFGFLLCPGGTPGPELEHTPPSWSVHFVPLGAVHASALGAVAPMNTAAPRTTPKSRFFMRCPPLLRGHLPPPIRPAHDARTRASPRENDHWRQVRRPRGVYIATRCVVVSVKCVESMGFRGRARRRRRPGGAVSADRCGCSGNISRRTGAPAGPHQNGQSVRVRPCAPGSRWSPMLGSGI
jgi:hypothetical protein